MAESRKKPSEGIALLSMYSDEDDEDMEDLNHEPPQKRAEEAEEAEQQVEGGAAADRVNDGGGDVMVTDEFGSNFNLNQNSRPQSRPPTPQEHSHAPAKQQQHARRSSRRGRLAIVDYAHDETAMSPELDEEEFDEELQIADGQEKTPPGTVQILTPNIQATPQSSEQLETSQHYDVNDTGMQSEDAENEAATNISAENIDALDKFLPPSPKEKCPEELRRKIEKFISLKKVGRSFNAEVRNRKDYRNPDFLLHAVRYQDIDQIGSCFSKDVFDPHGYDKSDYLDEIEADMRRERERKEQELKRSPKVEFISGGSQPGQVVPSSKFSMPIPAATAASGLHSASTAGDAVARDSRQNKKSKWDKVDGDVRNSVPTGGQDSLATMSAHTALLSAANAGAGYTAFVQQKRREAEEKRSSEKKLERRS